MFKWHSRFYARQFVQRIQPIEPNHTMDLTFIYIYSGSYIYIHLHLTFIIMQPFVFNVHFTPYPYVNEWFVLCNLTCICSYSQILNIQLYGSNRNNCDDAANDVRVLQDSIRMWAGVNHTNIKVITSEGHSTWSAAHLLMW